MPLNPFCLVNKMPTVHPIIADFKSLLPLAMLKNNQLLFEYCFTMCKLVVSY